MDAQMLNALFEDLLDSWLDASDDALMAMAERAEEFTLQTRHFAALRQFRMERVRLRDQFISSLSSPYPAPLTPAGGPEDLGLALADLRRRAQRLMGHWALQMAEALYPEYPEDFPYSPDHLCGALASAIGECTLPDSAMLVLCKRFDLQVLRALPDHIEPPLVADDAGDSPAPTGIEPELDPMNRGVRLAGHLLGQLRGLVAGREEGPTPKPESSDRYTLPELPELDDSEEAPAPLGREASRDEVLAALSVLQARAARDPELKAESISDIHHQLLQQIERLSTYAEPSRLGGEDEAALELLHRIFDFIGRDQRLSPLTESMLQRLRIPYLKAALLDPEFFSEPGHPARALLDELTAVSGDWSEHADRGDELHEKIGEVVQRILSDFEEDFAIFEPLLASFRRYGERLRRAAEIDRRKAARVEEGRERIREARTWAARAIGEHTRDAQLPPLIRSLLRRAWVNHMTLIWLRHGPESAEWQQALQLVDDLLWSVTPKQSTADVARLQSMLPGMARQLAAAFQNVAFAVEDSSDFFSGFRELLREQVAMRYRNALHLPESFARRAAFSPYGPLRAPGASRQQPLQDKEQDEAVWIRAVRGLQPGTWVQFRTEEGQPIRAKLSWVNPVSHKLLFVDSNGVKLADKSDVEFARELRAGEASVLENIPLFERAMGAIAEQLRTDPS